MSLLSSLSAIFEDLPRVRGLIIGDVMLDRFVYGDVRRLSPESPVPVLERRYEQIMAGGAGNVLANLSGLGVQATLLTVAGKDEAAAELHNLCAALPGAAVEVLATADRPTTVKTRYVHDRQHLLRVDQEVAAPLPADIRAQLLARADEMLDQADIVILSDYGKGVLIGGMAGLLIKRAQQHNVPVLVDPKGTDYSIYRGAAVVTPNRTELSAATGGSACGNDGDIEKAARQLIDEHGIHAVVATRSQDGMSVIMPEAPAHHIPTEALDVFDVSGAGDTVIATVAAALAAGAPLPSAAALANYAAGIVVARSGTAAIERSALAARLAGDLAPANQDGPDPVPAAHQDEKPPAWQAARAQIRRWQQAGLKVGFTNGCFDILHYGHVSYLARARDECDRLVVGLNADESVQRLKGPARPVNDQTARAGVIEALAATDMSVLFGSHPEENDTPCNLIEYLKPDIFFKGGDYKKEDLPEAAIVERYGGVVRLMDLYEGHSTTGIIKKVQK